MLTEGRSRSVDLPFLVHLPFLVYLLYCSVSVLLVIVLVGKIGITHSSNPNEGWSAFWAAAAWDGSGLYPAPANLKLNNYPPLWFYGTGALGSLIGDNITAGRILSGLSVLLTAAAVSRIVVEITGRYRASWFSGLVFLSIFLLFYMNYLAANDPQISSNCFMACSMLLFVRYCGSHLGKSMICLITAPLNNIEMLVWAKPDLESNLVELIAKCSYSLMQFEV